MSAEITVPTMSDLHCDCANIAELVDVLVDGLEDFSVGQVMTRPILDRYAALLWIARDLATALKDNLERVEIHQRQIAARHV